MPIFWWELCYNFFTRLFVVCSSLITVCLGVVFFVFMLLMFIKYPKSMGLLFLSNLETLAIISSKILSTGLFLFFWAPITKILNLLIHYHKSLRVCYFSPIWFSVRKVSMNLSSSTLSLFFFIFNLLLSLYSSFLILVIGFGSSKISL